jgi:cyclopropane-fatty-acyl-phospholipid synthase
MTNTADTNQHYDLDPEIFGLFLDPLRKYSSGKYVSADTTLAQAQVHKLHFVAERLGLQGGERVLDVGCGWGSLVLFMAREYGCQTLGISPAARQCEFITRQAEGSAVARQVRILQGRFEELALPEGGFDAITMLGSIVHMPDLPQAYQRCWRLLRRGGSLYVSESCFRNARIRIRFDVHDGTQFVRNSIFGWGEMRPLSELVAAAEDAGFSLASVDDLTNDYWRTIEDWISNVRANAARINKIQPGMAMRLAHYLEIANAGWGYTTKHYAIVCRKSR